MGVQTDKKPVQPVINEKLIRTMGFSDTKSYLESIKKNKLGHLVKSFADNDQSLDALLKSAPSAAGASPADVSDLGAVAATTSPGSADATSDLSAAAASPAEGEGKGKKEGKDHEAGESASDEAAEEKGVKESPSALMESIKKIVEGKDVAKAVKSKGEQAMAKLEELKKAIEDAKSFLSENPAPVEGAEGAKGAEGAPAA